MIDLSAALASGSLLLICSTAAGLGFLHTLLGPDHYLPFVAMAKSGDWTRRKTLLVTLACSIGHVASSLVIGVVLVVVGTSVMDWPETRWAEFHESRGPIAAWLLMGLGCATVVWGIVSALRGRQHSHSHAHADGTAHAHEHGHEHGHMHVHAGAKKLRKFSPWLLFIIFILGPCESLIPLMLAAWPVSGVGGVLLVSAAFSLTTMITMLAAVFIVLRGLAPIQLPWMERWSTALAGLSLILCGAGIQFLGL